MANGTDLKTVQDRMGHANGAITLNWYAHAIPENDQKAAQLVGNLFGATPKRTQRGHKKLVNIGENGGILALSPRERWSRIQGNANMPGISVRRRKPR